MSLFFFGIYATWNSLCSLVSVIDIGKSSAIVTSNISSIPFFSFLSCSSCSVCVDTFCHCPTLLRDSVLCLSFFFVPLCIWVLEVSVNICAHTFTLTYSSGHVQSANAPIRSFLRLGSRFYSGLSLSLLVSPTLCLQYSSVLTCCPLSPPVLLAYSSWVLEIPS